MMHLAEIMQDSKIIAQHGDLQITIQGITLNSKEVQPGMAFYALRGSGTDGHQFIPQAIAAGASAIICENLPETFSENCSYVQVENSAVALGFAASAFFDKPSEKLKLVGITGTNGKTSVATLLYQLYTQLGYPCGLLSTVENRIAGATILATHTTPNAIEINRLLAQMVSAGCEFAFMECSSHAIHQERIAGLLFTGAVFTNISHDHLDYHQTFSNYIKAKKKLFDDLPYTAFALVNKDDRNARVMVQNCKSGIYGYALKTVADFKGKVMEADLNGTLLSINDRQFWIMQPGEYNASNFTAVYGVAFLLGLDNEAIINGLTLLRGARGRFEMANPGQKPVCIVDYAHTPDALENLLNTINTIRSRNENLILVMGCGGNRDITKRPLMGETAARLADKVIFTSDNPRDEAPEAIIAEIQKGVPGECYRKTLAITDRKQAINAALQMAEPADIVVVAGKGHETYQEIKGVKHPFDDIAIIREQLSLLKN